MKKLLLSIFAVTALTVCAQSTVTVTVLGEVIQNGSTVDCDNLVVDDLSSPGDPWFSYALDPDVIASSSKEATFDITVRNVTTDIVEGLPQLSFCWPDGCANIDPFQSSVQSGILKSVPDPLLIHTLFLMGELPITSYWPKAFTIKSVVTIVEANNPSNTFTFNLNLIYDPEINAVGSVEADDATPVYFDLSGRRVLNPAKGQFVIERKGARAVKKVF